MFADKNYNHDIGSWNTSNVTDMSNMFGNNTTFNNGGAPGTSVNPMNWDTSNVITFAGMFNWLPNYPALHPFNQNIGGWNVSKCTSFNAMFYGCNSFNQDLSNWSFNTSPTANINMSLMFYLSKFNNGETYVYGQAGTKPLTWNMSRVNDISNMFVAYYFNQYVGDWDTSNIVNMNAAFYGQPNVNAAFNRYTGFNNGQGLGTIPNITVATSSYNNATKTLNCPGATFTTSVSVGDVIIIRTNIFLQPGASDQVYIYNSEVESITDDQNIVLVRAYGSNISAGSITNINKGLVGTAPLNWNTSKVTTMSEMFRGAFMFNQDISTKTVGSNTYWDTSNVTNVNTLFGGKSFQYVLFNNGQLPAGNSAPMNWNTSKVTSSTNWRQFSYVSNGNKPAGLP
jgi:hypothetical protein